MRSLRSTRLLILFFSFVSHRFTDRGWRTEPLEMKFLVLVLDEGMSRVERALLCDDGQVDLRCLEVLSPSPSPALSPPSPPSPAGASSPPPLSPVFPPMSPVAVNPEAESVLAEYRARVRGRATWGPPVGRSLTSTPCPLLEEENREAVDLLFPDEMLSAADGGDIFSSPPLSAESWLDLSCYDEDDFGFGGNGPFALDCPDEPGKDCASCAHHEAQSGVSGTLCSLCYMRQTYHCIYSESRGLLAGCQGSGEGVSVM